MKKYIAIIAIALCTAVSCDSFLDMTPRDSVSSKTIWENTANAEYSINFLYSYIYDLNAYPTSLGLTEALTDELKYTSYNYNAYALIPSEMAYGGSTLTANYVDVYMGCWGSLYQLVRRANEGICYLDEYGQMSDSDKTRLRAELRFLRAYYYFELIKRYKDVIIYDEDLSKIRKDATLSSESDAWDFVQKDLTEAAEALPVQSAANGRIDKGMAYAFLSRAMLYAGRNEAVVDAADKVAELGYSLESSYEDSYSKPLANGNKEAILQYTFDYSNGITHSLDATYCPGGDYRAAGLSATGSMAVPSQEIVECYELATGGKPDWSAWHSSSATSANPPYAQLEPRFQASILYNGAAWKGRNISPYVGNEALGLEDGLDGWAKWKSEKEPCGKTISGYYMRKNLDPSYSVLSAGSSQPLTFIRYAEVLLNKAEACCQTDAAAANAILAQIRSRVGLPYTNKSGSQLLDAIRAERRVELAFEGFRYWDLRRWGLADKPYSNGGLCDYQLHGLKIKIIGDNQYEYSYVSIDEKDRSFPSKMYRFPMPGSELDSNPNVEQYPEWK